MATQETQAEWQTDPIGFANKIWRNAKNFNPIDEGIFVRACNEAVFQGRGQERKLDHQAFAVFLDIQNKEAVEALKRGVGDRNFYSRLLEATAPDPDLDIRVKSYCKWVVGNLARAINREAGQKPDPNKPDDMFLRIQRHLDNLFAWNEYALAIPSVPTAEATAPIESA